jgi:hypothetical protein
MDCAFLCLLCVSVGAAQWVFGKQNVRSSELER